MIDTQDKNNKTIYDNRISSGKPKRKKVVFLILIAALFGVLILSLLCVLVILPVLPLALNNLAGIRKTRAK